MSPQADFIVSNGTGAAVRSDLNVQFAAIVSNNSGATEPATMYAYQWWADTTAGLLRLRNSANSAWVTIRQLDGEFSTVPVENGSAAAPSIYFKDSGTDSGFFSPGTDAVAISTAGTNRLHITSGGLVGIGTDSPSTPLHIQVSRTSSTNAVCLTLSDNVTGGQTDGVYKAIRSKSNNGASESEIRFLETSGANNDTGIAFATQVSAGALAERLRIDELGRVGIGTTTVSDKLHVAAGNITLSYADGSTGLRNKISWRTESPFLGEVAYIAANRTASSFAPTDIVIATGTSAGVSEKCRVTSDGRLLIGTSSAPSDTGNGAYYSKLVSVGNISSSTGDGRLALCRGTTASSLSSGNGIGEIHFADSAGGGFAMISAFADGTPGANDYPGRLVFSTTADGASSPTERMRINNAGATANFAQESVYHASSAAGAGTTHRLYTGKYSASATFGGTDSFAVWTNGNVINTNNSYGAISDIKLKENIVDASSQWDDLKALQVRNYNFKEGQTHTQIGLVAQEAELVSPGLVSESPDRDEDGNDLGTVTKSVNYSVLYMKAVKALQEAIAKIETLEGMVAVNNITIDEQQHQLSTLAARLTALESA
jgi:hypothetical protein